jgi:hypothetical protein
MEADEAMISFVMLRVISWMRDVLFICFSLSQLNIHFNHLTLYAHNRRLSIGRAKMPARNKPSDSRWKIKRQNNSVLRRGILCQPIMAMLLRESR